MEGRGVNATYTRCGEGEHKVLFSCKGKACPQCEKRYARDSMTKIATRLYLGVGYRQVVLTLPGCGLMGRTENYSHRGINNG
jgi:hypothetical protein